MAKAAFVNDMKDPIYRFAYDLVKEVVIIRGEYRHVHVKHPPPDKVLFTQEHADAIQDHLVTRNRAQELDRWINGGTVAYNIVLLRHYMNIIKEQSKITPYNDASNFTDCFIRACADIAYIAAHFMKRKVYNAQEEAIKFIKSLIFYEPEKAYF